MRALLILVVLDVAACSSNVAVDQAAAGVGGTASSTSIAATTGSGGATSSGSSATTGASSSTSTSASSGGAGCNPGCTVIETTCCNGACVATYNDVNNCGNGVCGVVCPGPNPFCDNGTCSALPACMLPPGTACNGTGAFCCGTFCCSAGQLCCNVRSNTATTNPQCADPVNGTCPIGCPSCP